MKKFVSIVIALVMVLSMTSAFAISDCDVRNYAWGCIAENTYCGKAAVDIVPYVHVNSDCNGDEFIVSDCAGAVADENIYFAIKLTVDAYPYQPWFDAGYVDFKSAGINEFSYTYETAKNADGFTIGFAGVDMDATEEEVYYWVGNTWVNVEDLDEDFVVGAPLYRATADNASKIELCAKIVSEYAGYDGSWDTIGDYEVQVVRAADKTWATTFDAAGNFTGTINVRDSKGNLAVYTVVDGTIKAVNEAADDGFVADVAAYLNLGCGIGVCVNKDNLKANFGWDDKQEDCFAWSKDAAAIVNPECSVEIPKTGDVSVVAYAVMAIVAAAGTMLKK